MKKICLVSLLLGLGLSTISCSDNSKKIIVGASPTPHAEILNSDIVKSYIESKGYKLEVIIYQDYVTPNKALNDGGIDANYFQHTPYLLEEVETKNYNISAACEVHYEPLNLYSKNEITDFSNITISIINDVSNIERALSLLKANSIIDNYVIENFDISNPNNYITTSNNVTLECLDPGLLANKVNDDGIAVIPGNYALNAWGSDSKNYKILGESKEVASVKSNIIAVKSEKINSDKTNILCEALAQEELESFITDRYGATVVYSFKDVR